MAAKPPDSARDRILKKAADEFAERGFSGARMEQIARRAKVDKKLLFYYFHSKEELFDTVMANIFNADNLVMDAPDEPVASVLFWQNFYAQNRAVVRLLLWEGLEGAKFGRQLNTSRQEISKAAVDKIRRHAGDGGWPENVDPGVFLVAWIALTIAPQLFPRLTYMITGLAPGAKELAAKHSEVLSMMAELIANRKRSPKED